MTTSPPKHHHGNGFRVKTERPALDRPLYRLMEAFGLKRYCPHFIATSSIQHTKKTYDLGSSVLILKARSRQIRR